MLLLAVTGEQKSKFKLWIQIRTNDNLSPMIYCENAADITLLI